MHFENPTPTPEKEPRFPSLEEVRAKMKELIQHENPEEIRTLEDEKGVYLYEVATVDEKGDASLYMYRRAGTFNETKAAETVIEVGYFAGSVDDGICVGGKTLSDYDEAAEKWIDAA